MIEELYLSLRERSLHVLQQTGQILFTVTHHQEQTERDVLQRKHRKIHNDESNQQTTGLFSPSNNLFIADRYTPVQTFTPLCSLRKVYHILVFKYYGNSFPSMAWDMHAFVVCCQWSAGRVDCVRGLPFQLTAYNHFFQLHYVGVSQPQQQGHLSEATDGDSCQMQSSVSLWGRLRTSLSFLLLPCWSHR